jgi:hypothetical protein
LAARNALEVKKELGIADSVAAYATSAVTVQDGKCDPNISAAMPTLLAARPAYSRFIAARRKRDRLEQAKIEEEERRAKQARIGAAGSQREAEGSDS